MTDYINKINTIASDIEGELISLRREIHEYPELGFHENRTAKLLAEKLEGLGIEVISEVGGTGLVGMIHGQEKGKTVALRGDMDALRIQEANLLSYSSKHSGVMHACGHDAHCAWLYGAAKILVALKSEIKGSVKIIYQPAEEGLGGAKAMIKDHVLENPQVDGIFGAHVWPDLELGQVGVRAKEFMASPAKFEIKIKGKGGHGAQPHKTIDPITVGCQVYNALQTIVSRRNDPVEPLVLSVTEFHSGSAHNIIPEEAVLRGTVRTFSKKLEEDIPKQMEKLISGITNGYGCDYDFYYDTYYPATINDSLMTDIVKQSVIKVLGKDGLIELDRPSMTGEDFSHYQQEIPGCFCFVGTRNIDKGIIHPLHNERFNIDEAVLTQGAKVLAACALQFLHQD